MWRSHIANLLRGILSGLLLVMLLLPSVDAQEDLFVVFGSVKIEETNKRMEGVKVLVYQDDNLYDELLTDAKGDYDFELPLRHNYSFRFDYEGYSQKKIDVDASGIPENVRGNRNMDLDMTLFELPPGFDASIFDSPYGRGDYDASKNTVVFDNNFTVRMRNRVQAEFARLERLGEELEQMQENFEAFVKKGDQSSQREEWQKAVDFYDSALAIFPENGPALAKRAEVQLKLDESLASSASQAAFEAKMDEGRSALRSDNLDAAIASFQEAAEMRPDAVEPGEGLKDVETRREELEREEEFNTIVSEADDLFGREQYEKAIKVYDEALRLMPDERYPIEKKEEAQTRIDDLANEAASIVERTIAYETLMSEGNKLFRGDDYADALLKFEEASLVLPAEDLPKQRAIECRERIAEAEEEENERLRREEERAEREAASAELRALQKQYDAINDEADILFRNDDYAAAIPKYAEALAVLPEERYPAQRMAEAQKRLDEAAAKAESEQNSANQRKREEETAQREEELKRAEEERIADRKEAERRAEEEEERQFKEQERAEKEAEREASRLADEAEAKSRAEAAQRESEKREAEKFARDEAERLERELRSAEALAAAEESALRDAEFNQLIREGDDAFNLADWDLANSSYTQALELKPNDRYASRRLGRISEEQERISEEQERRSRAIEAENEKSRREAMKAETEAAERAAELETERMRIERQEEMSRRQEEKRIREEEALQERALRESQARKKAAELATAMSNSESDEVEGYYREAMKSEGQFRQLDVENKKLQAEELARKSSKAAKERVEEDLRALEELSQEDKSRQQMAIEMQRQRTNGLNDRLDNYSRAESKLAKNEKGQLAEGEQKVKEQKEKANRLTRNRSRDYSLAQPELKKKKRIFRNLSRGFERTSAERRAVNAKKKKEQSIEYRRIGEGENLRAQERYQNLSRKAKRSQRRLANRRAEAEQRAFDLKEQEASRSKAASEGNKYILPEAEQDVLMGIHEESYDIPNGLVIERTLRKGNQVLRYRKVVTKTGIYYFKDDRSITVDTWKRETLIVRD